MSLFILSNILGSTIFKLILFEFTFLFSFLNVLKLSILFILTFPSSLVAILFNFAITFPLKSSNFCWKLKLGLEFCCKLGLEFCCKLGLEFSCVIKLFSQFSCFISLFAANTGENNVVRYTPNVKKIFFLILFFLIK